MKKRATTYKASGWSTLEFAASGIMLLGLVFGGFAAAMLIQSWVRLNYLVDKRLQDSAAQAFILEDSSALPHLKVNQQKLEEHIVGIKNLLVSDLTSTLWTTDLGIAGYFVESAYAVLEIDQHSGKFINITQIQTSVQGQYKPSLDLLSKTDLRKQFLQAALVTTGSGSNTSLYAVPSALFSDSGSNAQYLPYTVLVGVRVFSSLEGGAAGRLYAALLGEPVTYSFKSVMLRGEIGS